MENFIELNNFIYRYRKHIGRHEINEAAAISEGRRWGRHSHSGAVMLSHLLNNNQGPNDDLIYYYRAANALCDFMSKKIMMGLS